ncbi:site-specific integrase [Paenarthrobacter sp. FR1]|uniref:site-specific integrase n=1 Tax=Paenarthrobacter sp. FR1 TaxID=3439548 RepID=UPI003DA5681F
MTGSLGKVVRSENGPAYRLIFPGTEHEVVTSFLRDLAASDCSPATLRSYAYDLLRWFRFLHDRSIPWEHAERLDVRALVEHMRASPTANALRRGTDQAAATNVVTRKRGVGTTFSANSINHQLTVLSSFYDFALEMILGPLFNPAPRQRGFGPRAYAHHNPMAVPATPPRDVSAKGSQSCMAGYTGGGHFLDLQRAAQPPGPGITLVLAQQRGSG